MGRSEDILRAEFDLIVWVVMHIFFQTNVLKIRNTWLEDKLESWHFLAIIALDKLDNMYTPSFPRFI